MNVLEGAAVAAHDDQVHALLVLDLEVAHGPAAGATNAEPENVRTAALEGGVLESERQPVVRDGKTPDRRRSGRVGGVVSIVGLRVFRTAAVRADRAAREGCRAEQEHHRPRETRKRQSHVHSRERTIPPRGIGIVAA